MNVVLNNSAEFNRAGGQRLESTRTTVFPARLGLFPPVSFRTTEDSLEYISTDLRNAPCGICTCPAGSFGNLYLDICP